jgi:hypothetical protein
MSQINVNVVAPLSYTGPALVGDNDNVEIVDVAGERVLKAKSSNGHITIGGLNPVDTVQGCIAIGKSAGQNISSNGNGNAVIIGNNAMSNSMWTGGNIAIGDGTLQNATGISGIANIAIGQIAGQSVTDGFQNTIIGYGAATSLAGVALTTGDNNLVLGSLAATASANSNNSVTLGNASITALRCAVTSITSLSDARDKKEVEDLNVGLEFIDGLRPVKFVWDDRDEKGKHDVSDFGFIAQDLKAAEDAVEMADVLKLVYDENPEKLEASYGKLIPILVKAIQELSAKVELLENK